MSNGTVMVLRTCKSDMTAHGDFKWPESGPVAAPDWSPEKVCGQGLHGLLWGDGDWSLMSREIDAKWMIVEVDPAEIVDLGGKVKFPRGNVVFCGNDAEAITRVLCGRERFEKISAGADGAPAPEIASGYGSKAASSGNYSKAASSGDSSKAASSGNYSKAASSGDSSTAASSGDSSTAASSGNSGIAMVAGFRGSAKAGPNGAFALCWKDGERPRIVACHVGEGGVKADTWYRLDAFGALIEQDELGNDVALVVAVTVTPPTVTKKTKKTARAAKRVRKGAK
jgi:hypothetical protein